MRTISRLDAPADALNLMVRWAGEGMAWLDLGRKPTSKRSLLVPPNDSWVILTARPGARFYVSIPKGGALIYRWYTEADVPPPYLNVDDCWE